MRMAKLPPEYGFFGVSLRWMYLNIGNNLSERITHALLGPR